MGRERWPKRVGEALSRLHNKGTCVDFVRSLVSKISITNVLGR